MIAKLSLGRSIRGLAAYCLHGEREGGSEPGGELDGRVEWTDTRNLPTGRPDRAVRVMVATAVSSAALKRAAGVRAGGRRLEKPVAHLTLSWPPGETPDCGEMGRAVEESLTALGVGRHQALVVAHVDRPHRHVHVIVNRVDPENGKAAKLSKSRLRLSEWAQEWERRENRIRCWRRVENNDRRAAGARVVDRVSLPTGRYRRERLSPHQADRVPVPAGRSPWEREVVAWQRAEERVRWEQLQRRRVEELEARESRWCAAWRDLTVRQEGELAQLEADGRGIRGVAGRLRRWRRGGRLRELGAAIGARRALMRRWRADLKRRQLDERVRLGRGHTREVRAIEEAIGEAYQRRIGGLGERAERAARTRGWGMGMLQYDPPLDLSRLQVLADAARLEQVREVEGEEAYRERIRRIDKLRELGERAPSRPTPQRPPRDPEREGGIER